MKKIFLLLLLIVVTVGCSKEKNDTIELKFAHVYSPNHPYSMGVKEIIKRVSERTEGKVLIKEYPAGQLGGEKDLADGLTNGVVDIAYVGPGELGKRYAPISIYDAPFIFEGYEHGAAVVRGPEGEKIYSDLAKEAKINVLGVAYYGARYVTTKDKEVKTPKDLRGVKLRSPDMPLYTETTKAMGALPTPMALSEVYLALQQGVVDGQENPIATIDSQKFYEVQKYIIGTKHIVCFTPVVMSTKGFESLPKEYQDIIGEEVRRAMTEVVDTNILALEKSKIEEFEDRGMVYIEPDRELFRKEAEKAVVALENQWGVGLYEKLQNVKY